MNEDRRGDAARWRAGGWVMAEEGSTSPRARPGGVKWICGTVVALGLFTLVGVLALGGDTPFTLEGSFQGATFTVDLSGAEDVGGLVDELLAGDAAEADPKRAAVVDALARHGFVDVANDPVRLEATLEALPPESETAARLRGMVSDLHGPFALEFGAGPLAEAGADFTRAIYRLGPEHALVRRLVADFLEGRSFAPPHHTVRVAPDGEVPEKDLAICRENPLRDYNDAQIFRMEAQRSLVGRLQVRTDCGEHDLVRVHPLTWRRLGGDGGHAVMRDAMLSPLPIGTFFLAESHARLCRAVDGGR
jgi:hypothetical protein